MTQSLKINTKCGVNLEIKTKNKITQSQSLQIYWFTKGQNFFLALTSREFYVYICVCVCVPLFKCQVEYKE